MAAYYNEIDPYAAAWLRNLIAAGHIAPGDADERSITEVSADDVRNYTQCHWFAGIGGWSYALRLAGWDDARPVWTGSCPCQPFSVAGKGKAQSDDRHLWPAWFSLIKSVQPPVVFGEQVAGAIAHGWLDDAFDDLEGQGYETAACVLPACSVGAPHKRDRLWFVAHTGSTGWGARGLCQQGNNGESVESRRSTIAAESGEASSPLANLGASGDGGEQANFWFIEPDVGRVANGVSARVGKLRAFGNAIVPQVAAEFIKAYCG